MSTGLLTNAGRDLRMSPADRVAAQVAEKQDAVIQGAIEKGRESGAGSAARPSAEGSSTSVTTHAVTDLKAFQTSRKEQVTPTWKFHPDTREITSKVYSASDYDAVMNGYYCRNCDLSQRDVIPVRGEIVVPAWDAASCLTVTGVSCGAPRRGELPYKILSITK